MLSASLILALKEQLEQASCIYCICHEKPDGDAIASLLALGQMLEQIGKTDIQLISRDGVPEAFSFLPGHTRVQTDFIGGNADLIITVDCGDFRRTGFSHRLNPLVQKGIPLINIDHHPKNDLHRLALINLVDYSAASTTQILFNLCAELHIAITPVLATHLFTGLYTDTGSFQHAVTTPQVLKVASTLLAEGARIKDLRKHLTYTKPVSMLKLWGIVLSRVKVTKLGLTISVITQEDLRRTGATEDDISGAVNMLETIDACRAALLVVEMPDGTLKGSLRSNNSKVNVAKIAKMFGGGGHPRASGFTFPAKLLVDEHGWNVV